MPSRLESISANPTIREYAMGAAQQAIQPVANFLAPTVDVSATSGKYKLYTEKSRFSIPNTLRAVGGRAVEIGFDVTDADYNCGNHAIDYPIDRLESLAQKELEDAVKEGATAVAEIASLSHEKAVIDAAIAALGSGTEKTWNGAADPVADLDEVILAVIKAAKYGSLMGVGVLFGAQAWRIFKNHASVRGRYVVGNKAAKATATPTEIDAGTLLIAQPNVKASYMVYDTKKEGQTEAIDFLLGSQVIVFASREQPTRRDPSFMKTFRLMGQWMVPGFYTRDDQRVEVCKFDWSEDVKVVNSAAARLLTIKES